MRSVVVVFPASMCAMMPKLRTLLRSVSTSFCATEVFPLFRLLGCCSSAGLGGHAAAGGLSPAVVREGSVRFGHLVGVFASLDRSAQAIAGIEELVGQALDHRLLAALPREAHQPAQGQRGGTVSAHLDGHLVGRATHAGLTLSRARLRVTTGSVPVFSRACSSAPYTMRSASDFFPFSKTLSTSWVTSWEP